MKAIKAIMLVIILIIFILVYNSFYKYKPSQKDITIVTNVIDGDTIVISGGERARLLGIDAPEKGEFYYKESKVRLEQLIENKEVALEREGENKDKYDRLLRYIFLNDTNVNLLLVEEGYAICYFYGQSKYQDSCRQLEDNAMQNKIGRWQNNS